MNLVDKVVKNAEKLLYISFVSICEVFYLSKALFDISNSFLLSCFVILSIVVLTILITSLPKKITLSILAVLVLSLCYFIYNYIEPISNFFVSANSSLVNRVYIQTQYNLIVLFSLSMLISFINYVLIFVLNKSILSAVLSIILVCIVYFSYNYMNLVFASFYIATVLLIFIRWASPTVFGETNKKSKQFLVPFLIVFIAAVLVAPISVIVSYASPEPLKWIDDLDWFESSEPEPHAKTIIRIDGQSTLSNLADQFKYTDTKMMIVTSPYIDRLRNKTYDSYIRNSWSKAQDDIDSNKDHQYSNLELMEILEANNIYYSEYTMTVELIAQSQMVFAPLHSELSTSFTDKLNTNPYDDMYLKKPLEEGTIYSLDALHIEYRSPEFINLITNSQSDSIDNIENYVGISDKLKDSLKPLALGLTKDAKSNYEKAKIIESYLSTQYTYTLEPPEKPENYDFVEYFLFETKRGFCTHYASSMVMILRSIDIPCRYVTGYLLDSPAIYANVPDEILDHISFVEGKPYEFNVEKQNSHAWVEVWFDDFGWLAFEPTSKYTSSLGFGYTDSYIDFENVELVETPREHKSYKDIFIILGSLLLLILILLAIVRIFTVSKRTDTENIVNLWNRIKKLYYKNKKINKRNETAREFYLRADKLNNSLRCALSIYENTLFSNKEIDSSTVDKMKELYRIIKSDVKNNKKNY